MKTLYNFTTIIWQILRDYFLMKENLFQFDAALRLTEISNTRTLICIQLVFSIQPIYVACCQQIKINKKKIFLSVV